MNRRKRKKQCKRNIQDMVKNISRLDMDKNDLLIVEFREGMLHEEQTLAIEFLKGLDRRGIRTMALPVGMIKDMKVIKNTEGEYVYGKQESQEEEKEEGSTS